MRTIIADDYLPFRRLLREFLACEPEVEFVAEADNGQDTIAKALQLGPDVILMDISMPGVPSLEALRVIKTYMPGVKVIVLLDEDNREYRNAALESGASDCIAKELAARQLPLAMRAL
ncbi:MAG: response regulator transcription factor [Chloroflexi bacterium]|nr:response regulator transcription factor [Chloroflexota bacterium]